MKRTNDYRGQINLFGGIFNIFKPHRGKGKVINFINRTKKPFDAILGETFEYTDKEDNLLAITEQVCHEPPICAGHIQNDLWELSYVSKKKVTFQLTVISL